MLQTHALAALPGWTPPGWSDHGTQGGESSGLELIDVEGSGFPLGTLDADAFAYDNERPPHRVAGRAVSRSDASPSPTATGCAFIERRRLRAARMVDGRGLALARRRGRYGGCCTGSMNGRERDPRRRARDRSLAARGARERPRGRRVRAGARPAAADRGRVGARRLLGARRGCEARLAVGARGAAA